MVRTLCDNFLSVDGDFSREAYNTHKSSFKNWTSLVTYEHVSSLPKRSPIYDFEDGPNIPENFVMARLRYFQDVV